MLQQVRPTKKFSMGQTSDEYVCFSMPASALRGDASTDKRHAIAFGPHIDNPKIVHHIILFQVDASKTSDIGPDPAPCEQGVGGSARFVAGWAPGGGNYEMPAEAGFPQDGTSKYVVQVHLNNQQGLVGEVDGSGFDMCVGAPRANDADVMATGTVTFSIPPRSDATSTCDYTWNKSKVHVFSASPHMHKFGRSLSVTRKNASGDVSIMNEPNFDFSVGGGGSPVAIDLERGDKLHTVCKWSNATDNPVKFGENTGDEMCFAFLMYYPRVDLAQFAVPSILASCKHETQ